MKDTKAIKNLKDMDNIFIGDKPLDEFLVDSERDEKSHEIEALRQEAQKKHKPSIVFRSERSRPAETKRVATRVRRWRDREIRKEYGIMARPFKEKWANIIWAIFNKGPITTSEIGEEIEWSGGKSTLSALLSTIWLRLGDQHPDAAGIIVRETLQGGMYSYEKKPGVDISVEAAVEKFKLLGRKSYQKKVQAAKAKAHPKTEVPAAANPPANTPAEVPAAGLVNDMVGNTVGKLFNIAVKVGGRIEIVFRIER